MEVEVYFFSFKEIVKASVCVFVCVLCVCVHT